MMGRRILILGGTADARELAELLDRETDCEVITSLAGRTSQPAEQAGTVRVGGFGGADPLAGYLKENEINLLIDATHPYAAQISANAAAASSPIALLCICRMAERMPNLGAACQGKGQQEGELPHPAGSLGAAASVNCPSTPFAPAGRSGSSLSS